MSTTTEVKPLLAFHNDPAIKAKYLERLMHHRAADEIIQGITWEKTGEKYKGCAVGCTLHNYSHAAYETELGIPRILARLEDRIFEGLSVEDSKDFPVNFLSAIPVGRNLFKVYKYFLVWMLSDPEDGVIRYAKTERTKESILNVSAKIKYSLDGEVTRQEWIKLRNAAYAYADAAADAYAAYAAYAADAADAAAAAYAYADAAAYATYAAYDADAADAYAAARRRHYRKMADKLIELLQAA